MSKESSLEFASFQQVLALFLSAEVVLLIDIVMGAFWVPVGVTHVVFVGQVFLWSPHLLGAVWVLLRWERSLALWNVDLVLCHQVMESRIHLVLEPSEGHTEIVVGMDTNGQFTWNGIPRILVHVPNWSVTVGHLRHLIVGSRWPENFNLFSLGVGNDLPADVGLVGLVEDIDAHVDNHVCVVNLLGRGEAHLLDAESLTAGKPRHATHELIDVSRLWNVVPVSSQISVQFLDVLHGPGAVVCWDWTRLPDWMDVSHVINRRRWVRVECLDIRIHVLRRWQFLWQDIVLEIRRVVGTVRERHGLHGRHHSLFHVGQPFGFGSRGWCFKG